MRSTFVCPSCGAKTKGHFCGNCGEKEVGQSDYSSRHFIKELGTALTLLDSKAFRSLWLLIRKPGYLSSEFFRGRRVQYLKPLQLFVFLNVVYYFSLSLFVATTFTTPLATQLLMNDYYPAHARRQVDLKMQTDHITYQALEAKYDQKTGILSKTLIFLLIPIFAGLFYVLFFKKRRYFVDHVVVATHFYAATNWYCAATASAIAWSFFHIVWLYRFCLFEITLKAV